MSRLLDHLRGHGEKVAVLTDSQQLSYRQLADAVADTARELGGACRLVLLETRNDLATLVHYLAAMAVGHVVLPVDARRDHTAILQTYEPDVVIDANGIHRGGGRHRRAVAILLIVGSHAGLFELWGGAHLLLGIAGYNFGRFCLTPVPRPDRVRHLRNTIAWIAGPSVAWIAIALMITDDYASTNLLLANKFLGPHDSMTAGRLWFVEVLVWILVALAVLCWLPVMDRLKGSARLPSRWRSWPPGWRCDTTSSACTWAATHGSRCWRSGSSRWAGPRPRGRPRCSARR